MLKLLFILNKKKTKEMNSPLQVITRKMHNFKKFILLQLKKMHIHYEAPTHITRDIDTDTYTPVII
jgi:hypothetical protein